jgi:hypothetical protein
MIASDETVQLRAWYQNPGADSPHLEMLVGYQIVQRALTNRKKCGGLLTANQQFVLGIEPSLLRALLGGENLIIHFVTPGKMLSIWIARLRGNVRAATAYGAYVSPVTSELGFRFSYVEEAISEPLMSFR